MPSISRNPCLLCGDAYPGEVMFTYLEGTAKLLGDKMTHCCYNADILTITEMELGN